MLHFSFGPPCSSSHSWSTYTSHLLGMALALLWHTWMRLFLCPRTTGSRQAADMYEMVLRCFLGIFGGCSAVSAYVYVCVCLGWMEVPLLECTQLYSHSASLMMECQRHTEWCTFHAGCQRGRHITPCLPHCLCIRRLACWDEGKRLAVPALALQRLAASSELVMSSWRDQPQALFLTISIYA